MLCKFVPFGWDMGGVQGLAGGGGLVMRLTGEIASNVMRKPGNEAFLVKPQ